MWLTKLIREKLSKKYTRGVRFQNHTDDVLTPLTI